VVLAELPGDVAQRLEEFCDSRILWPETEVSTR
jgi:hypothetical protein